MPGRGGATQFVCGHPRTIENTKRVRSGEGTACKQCWNKRHNAYMRGRRGHLGEKQCLPTSLPVR